MKIAIGCFIGLILSVSIGAESLFEGQVRLESGEPIANAQVRLFDLTDLRRGAIAHAMTDGTGYFSLPLTAMTGRTLPERFALGPNYPNPFNPSTIIPYQLAASSAVRLEVFNLLGQRIATLVDGEQSAGFHTATWHATDAAGRAVGAGVYIYRMTVGAESQTGRMVLIDGQAGVSAAGAASSWSGVSGGGEDAQVYGLIVSGRGLVPYVDPSFRVEAGMAPVELVVSPGQYSAGKTVDFGDLFDLFNDAQEEEADETEEEEAETDSTSSEGGPDLIVQSPSVNHSILTPGQAFTLHVTVHNQGDEQAAATMLHYYRSNNAKITASDTEMGTDAVDVLDASDSSVQSIELTASVGVERYYGACVTSVRGESNTDNNCSAAVRITVGGQVATEDSTETDLADSVLADSQGFNIEPDTTLPAPTEPFNIDLYWEINYPAPFIEAVERAAYKWESIITQGLEDGNREHLPSDVPDIDDLAIVVRLNDKPGANQEGNVYGAATIYLRRTAEHYTNDVGIPIYGSIYLPDKPEYREGYKNNEYVKYYSDQLNFLAIHEIGHVLGLAYSFLAQDGNGFSRAYSPKALEVWKQHVPQQYHQGRNYVPIHSGHWSYQYPASDYAKMWIITNSTMTIFRLSQFDVFGHYRAYDNPGGDTYYTDKIITELDVAALDDMGYTVDMDQAEPLMVKMKSAASYGFGKANTYSQIICEGIH